MVVKVSLKLHYLIQVSIKFLVVLLQLKMENKALKDRITALNRSRALFNKAGGTSAHLKALLLVKCNEENKSTKRHGVPTLAKDESRDKILNRVRTHLFNS